MKITVQQGKMLKFEDVEVGKVFIYNTRAHIKTISLLDKHEDYEYNAIDLSNDGEMCFFVPSQLVEPVEAELKVWR